MALATLVALSGYPSQLPAPRDADLREDYLHSVSPCLNGFRGHIVQLFDGSPEPDEYLDLLRETNGTVGPIAIGQGRIHVYSTSELDGGLSSSIALDGFFVFGTDGAGTAFAIRMGMMDVVMVTTTAIITVIASGFDEFLLMLDRS